MIARGSALRFKARSPHSIGWATNAQTSQRAGGSAPFLRLLCLTLQLFDMVCVMHFTAPLPRGVFQH